MIEHGLEADAAQRLNPLLNFPCYKFINFQHRSQPIWLIRLLKQRNSIRYRQIHNAFVKTSVGITWRHYGLCGLQHELGTLGGRLTSAEFECRKHPHDPACHSVAIITSEKVKVSASRRSDRDLSYPGLYVCGAPSLRPSLWVPRQ
jgi:hypothetical protein